MAFWSILGNTAVTDLVDGRATGTDIDAGSIRFGGTIAESRFQSVAIGEGNPVITIVSGVDGVDGAVPGAFNAGDQVIVRVTTDIAGTSNNVLRAGASNSANDSRSINQAETIEVKLYKTAIRNGEWNPVTAAFDTEPLTVAQSGGWNLGAGVDNSTTLSASGTDNAANPTQDVPGELVYNYGSGSDPTQDEYKVKNIW